MEPIHCDEIERGLKVYTYRTDRPFVIEGIGRYALNCSVNIVTYLNIHPTDDAAPFTRWHLEEDLFLKMFYTKHERHSIGEP